MKRSLIVPLLLLCISIFFEPIPTYASTVAVGNCRPDLISYSTISDAVAAVAPGSTVLVCSGTYPEQITITIPLTITGDSSISPPIVTVPAGGLSGPQITADGTNISPAMVVNLSNMIVDGRGASGATGIFYTSVSGQLSRLEVRNQSIGISLVGDPVLTDTVSIQDSYIHSFTNTGVSASDNGATSDVVNIARSRIQSNNPSVQSGISSIFTDGLITENSIIVKTGTGLLLSNFFVGVTAEKNYIEGAGVGIMSEIGFQLNGNTITDNTLFNNATGIYVQAGGGGDAIAANLIIQSSVDAIDLECSDASVVEKNVIYGTPVGVANIRSGDTVSQNAFFRVGAATTPCSQ